METPLWFVFGLFVYFRQASLSLHRSDIEDFPNEIKEYYQHNKIPYPESLIEYLKDDTTILLRDTFPEDATSIADMKCQNKKINLSDNEIVQIIRSLEEYAVFFNIIEGHRFNVKEKNKIRLLLTNCTELLEKKLPPTLVEKGNFVTHKNQNNQLELFTFQELVGVLWPIKKK